ncbi:MAG TPA: hypothetical protein VFH70_01055 [Acidimicrobiales bacterium]|nr:hypothetical protein [Acidimicrobiales bacterium]
MVSRLEQLGANIPYPPATVEASRERLFGAGVDFVPAMALSSVSRDEVVAHGLGDGRQRRFGADAVVIVTYHQPNAELADYLEADGVRVHRAGNVNGTDSIQAAIREAALIARSI